MFVNSVLLTTALGCTLGIAGFIQMSFSKLDSRIEGLEKRTEGLDSRMGGLEKSISELKGMLGLLTGWLSSSSAIMPYAFHGACSNTALSNDAFGMQQMSVGGDM